jgi:hypothetical protein
MAYVNPIGGLTNPRASISNLGRTDQGVDVTGSGPVYAMGSGTVLETMNSGWPAGGFILIHLDNPINGHAYYYTAENIQPTVSINQRVSAGQKIGTARGGSPYLELGWAAGPSGQTLAQATTGYKEGQVTPAGQDFKSVLTSLMSGNQPAGGTSRPASSPGSSGSAAGQPATLTAQYQPRPSASGTGTANPSGCITGMLFLPVLLPYYVIRNRRKR